MVAVVAVMVGRFVVGFCDFGAIGGLLEVGWGALSSSMLLWRLYSLVS